jgi:hypothetical protein
MDMHHRLSTPFYEEFAPSIEWMGESNAFATHLPCWGDPNDARQAIHFPLP